MKLKVVETFFLLAYIAAIHATAEKSGADTHVDASQPKRQQQQHGQQQKQTMAFEKDQLYKDFFPLGSTNFTKSILHSRMVWVVFFHDGMLERTWKLSAVNFRGIIRFGMIDRKQEPKLVKELKLAENTTARVYPHGGKIIKNKYFEDCVDSMDAVNKAEKSLPDKVPRMNVGDRIEDLLMDAYASRPTKFPALFLTREVATPTIFRALALRFERYFSFRLLKDPSVGKMRRLGLPSDFYYHIPGVVILITENFEDSAKRRFYAVQYDKSSMGGDLTYPNAVMFLLQVNRQFRHKLPGDNEDDDEDIVKATDVMLAEQEIFDIKDEYFSKSARTRQAAPAESEKNEGKSEDPYLKMRSEEL